MAAKVVSLTPPPLTRGGGPQVDAGTIEELTKAAENGWAGLDETYDDQKAAAYQANKWKRYISDDHHKVRSRVWQDGNKWRFALKSETVS